MHVSNIRLDGTLKLGRAAEQAGFTPGTLVQVILTRAGSLILAIDHETTAIDVLPAFVRPLALAGEHGMEAAG